MEPPPDGMDGKAFSGRVWAVVGGSDKGGILVRTGQELTSAQEPERLSTGATVREQVLMGERLNYSLLTGSGPPSGWVSIRLKDKDLLVKTADEAELASRRRIAEKESQRKRAAEVTAAAARPRTTGEEATLPGAGHAFAPALRALPEVTVLAAGTVGGTYVGDQGSGNSRYAALKSDELLEQCREHGLVVEQLDDPKQAPRLLEQIESLERKTVSEFKSELRKRGFPVPNSMSKDDMAAHMKDILIFEHIRVVEFRRVCRSLSLPVQGSETQAELMQMIAAASWEARGIPMQRLPSAVVAYGLLDQLESFEASGLPQLAKICKRKGLPVEDEPVKDTLVQRLRVCIIWEQLPLQELRKECEELGVLPTKFGVNASSGRPTPGAPAGWHQGDRDRAERQEYMRSLVELMWNPPTPEEDKEEEEEDEEQRRIRKCFEALQLPPTATLADLKRQFRRLEIRQLLGKNLGEEELAEARKAFAEVSKAFETLRAHLKNQESGKAGATGPPAPGKETVPRESQGRAAQKTDWHPPGEGAKEGTEEPPGAGADRRREGAATEVPREVPVAGRARGPRPAALPPGTTILLARHGERIDDFEMAQGRLWVPSAEAPWDPELTDRGWQMASALGLAVARHLERLGLPALSRVFSSPFVRCFETAVGVARENQLDSVCVEPSLSESFCEFFYRSWSLPNANGVWGGPEGCGIGTPVERDGLRPAARSPASQLLPPERFERVDSMAVKPDDTYKPLLPLADLKYQWDDFETEELLSARMRRFFDFVADAFPGETVILISHGGPLKALVESLLPAKPSGIPGYCSLFVLHRASGGSGNSSQRWTSPVFADMEHMRRWVARPAPAPRPKPKQLSTPSRQGGSSSLNIRPIPIHPTVRPMKMKLKGPKFGNA